MNKLLIILLFFFIVNAAYCEQNNESPPGAARIPEPPPGFLTHLAAYLESTEGAVRIPEPEPVPRKPPGSFSNFQPPVVRRTRWGELRRERITVTRQLPDWWRPVERIRTELTPIKKTNLATGSLYQFHYEHYIRGYNQIDPMVLEEIKDYNLQEHEMNDYVITASDRIDPMTEEEIKDYHLEHELNDFLLTWQRNYQRGSCTLDPDFDPEARKKLLKIRELLDEVHDRRQKSQFFINLRGGDEENSRRLYERQNQAITGDSSNAQNLLSFLASDTAEDGKNKPSDTSGNEVNTETGSSRLVDLSSLANDENNNQVGNEQAAENEKNTIEVKIDKVKLNQWWGYRPGEKMVMKIFFMIKNAEEKTKFNIYGDVQGIGNFSKNMELEDGNHEAVFKFTVPSLTEGKRYITPKIKWLQNDEMHKGKLGKKRPSYYLIKYPKISSDIKIDILPRVLTPGCKAEFYSYVSVKDFSSNSSVRIMVKFHSNLFKKQPLTISKIVNFEKWLPEGKEFDTICKVPSDTKPGTYKISMQVVAKGAKFKAGPKTFERTFIVQKHSYTVYTKKNKETNTNYMDYCSYNISKNTNNKYIWTSVKKRYLKNKDEAIREIRKRVKNIKQDKNGKYFGDWYKTKYFVPNDVANYGKNNRN
ncbi:MAG TPA: hypothetical protein QF753_13640 [Victivallales bacterium]|nr:hypothetical protein [Victivallales bacterium]